MPWSEKRDYPARVAALVQAAMVVVVVVGPLVVVATGLVMVPVVVVVVVSVVPLEEAGTFCFREHTCLHHHINKLWIARLHTSNIINVGPSPDNGSPAIVLLTSSHQENNAL